MSYSELKAFDSEGYVVSLEEFRNSHYIPVIWDTLAEKYGIHERVEKELIAKNGVCLAYEVRGYLMQDMTYVWDLQYDPNVSDSDWLLLMFTFDNAIVPPERIEELAIALEEFIVPEKVVDHGKGFAACIRKAAREIDGIRGIALHATSVCEDPWGSVKLPFDTCSECNGPIEVDSSGEVVCKQFPEDHWSENPRRPYNLDKDTKHWFIPAREDWRKDE